MAADGKLVFAAYGNVFSAFARNKEVCIPELFYFACLLQLVIECHDSGENLNVAILHLGHYSHLHHCFMGIGFFIMDNSAYD